MSIDSINTSGDFRVGDVMSRAWRIFTGNILFFLLVPFIMQLITIVVVVVFAVTFIFAGWAINAAGLAAVGIVLALIFAVGLHMIGQGLLLVGAFQRLRGEPLRVGEAVQRVMGRFVPLTGLGILWSIAIVGAPFAFFFVVTGLTVALGGWVLVLAPAFLVPPIILFVIWVAVIPACIVEGRGPIASMNRSAGLTKGYRWKIFAITALFALLLVVAGVVQMLLMSASEVIGAIFSFIWPVAWIAYLDCTIIMIYHDLRVAKEGVDTEQVAAIFD
jgi:hypothetical protein